MADDCTDCDAARLHAKAEGHRNWRTGWVCFEHAAFDLDSPAGRALFGHLEVSAGVQRDLFRENS